MEIRIFLVWYLVFMILGVIGLPLSNKLFKGWKDHGYGFAKLIGLFFVAMPLWFLASLKLIPFSEITVWLITMVAFAAALYYVNKSEIKLNRYIIFEEIAFLVLLIIWCIIRGDNPRIEGTEKFMNLAFMNSILRAEYFPPLDPWYTGGTINYYYLGHYLYTFVAKLTGIGINYAYNYALVTIIAQSFISLFSVISNVVTKSKTWLGASIAFLGAAWISFGGNMHYAFNWFWAIMTGEEFSYFFPDATRIIPFTINEFPAYSIVLGDVHGHYLALPFTILIVGLIIVSYKIAIDSRAKLKFNLLISFIIISLYGINSWDFLTANFMFVSLHAWQAYKLDKERVFKIKHFLLAEASLILPGFIFMLPYFLNFSAPLIGKGSFYIDKFLGLVPAFYIKNGVPVEALAEGEQAATGLFSKGKFRDVMPWLAMWGMFLSISVSYYYLRTKGWLGGKMKNINLLGLLVFAALALVVGVEIFYLKDIFHVSNPNFFRTNTVFKFYYHAWIIWGIAASWMGYLLVKGFLNTKQTNRKYILFTLLFVIGVFYVGSIAYIEKAVKDFYPEIKIEKTTLDGYNYIKEDNTKVGDYHSITWINENITGQPVFAEAVGDAYTYYARISANTGVITPMGWPTHEWQWRGDSDTPFARQRDIESLYTASEVSQAREVIQKYKIEYIYIGGLEEQKYPNLNQELLSELGESIYTNEYGSRIIKVD